MCLSLVIACCAGVALGADAAQAETRGITVTLVPEPGIEGEAPSEFALYRSSYALVIGNDAYVGGWPPLRNAIKDAELIAEELERQGFEVELRTDLGSKDLQWAFKEFLVSKGSDPEARLLVWYAGHGTTVNGEAFLVPVDAPADKDPKFALSAYPLSEIDVHVRLAKAKHVLAIFDSCFAGTIFQSRAGLPPVAITRATTLPVRQFVTSGDADQPVSDNGDFRKLFLRAIRGEDSVDTNTDGYVTGSELGYFLADRVTNLTQGAQTPRYGKLLHTGFDRGDFVFVLPGSMKAAQSEEPASDAPARDDEASATAYELAFWDSVEASTNAADYHAYLDAYPAGVFAPLAKVRIQSLEGQAPAEPGVASVEDQDAAAQASELAMIAPAAGLPDTPPLLDTLDSEYVALKNANVRLGPSTDYPVGTQLLAGSTVRVVGKVRGADWYAVGTPDAPAGYVYASLLEDADTYAARKTQEAAAFEADDLAQPRDRIVCLDGVFQGPQELPVLTQIMTRTLTGLPGASVVREPPAGQACEVKIAGVVDAVTFEVVVDPKSKEAQEAAQAFSIFTAIATGGRIVPTPNPLVPTQRLYKAQISVRAFGDSTASPHVVQGYAEMLLPIEVPVTDGANQAVHAAASDAAFKVLAFLTGGETTGVALGSDVVESGGTVGSAPPAGSSASLLERFFAPAPGTASEGDCMEQGRTKDGPSASIDWNKVKACETARDAAPTP
ncbi:MAG: caspase family protein [Alphaproteobacteria bacterium]